MDSRSISEEDPRIKALLRAMYPGIDNEYQSTDPLAKFYIRKGRGGRKSPLDLLNEEIDAYQRMLRALDKEFLQELFVKYAKKLSRTRRTAIENALSRYELRHPSFIAVQETYIHWLKANTWTMEEAVALAIGLNPVHVDLRIAQNRKHIKIAQDYLSLYDFAERSFDDAEKLSPSAFALWIEQWDHKASALFKENASALSSRPIGLQQINEDLKKKLSKYKDYDKRIDRSDTLEKIAMSRAIALGWGSAAKEHTVVGKMQRELAGDLWASDDSIRGTIYEIAERLKIKSGKQKKSDQDS